MNELDFRKYLLKMGKKDHVVDGLLLHVHQFAVFLEENQHCTVDIATTSDLEDYLKTLSARDARVRMRGLAHYYKFTGNQTLANLANGIREQGIARNRQGFRLRDFRGVDQPSIEKLETFHIRNTQQLLDAGRRKDQREALSRQTGIPEPILLELIKLSDLARLPGVKGIRARLYYDAGVDSVEKMAGWEAQALLNMVTEFAARTKFDGFPPLPKEVSSTIASARALPKIIEF